MASKKALMIQRTHEYLKLHQADPAAHPLTVEAVAAFVPASRRLFYKKDPEIAALLDLISSRIAPSPSPKSVTLGGSEVGQMDERGLEREIAQVVARAVWTMQKFVGQHKRTTATLEAALAAHDLDETISILIGCQHALEPLVAEHERRRRAAAGAPAPNVYSHAPPSLFDEGEEKWPL